MVGTLTVVNRYKGHEPGVGNNIPIYRGTPLGNPFKIGEQNPKDISHKLTKEDVIDAYEGYFDRQIAAANESIISACDTIAWKLIDGEDVQLVCYCAPKPCHGDTIKKRIDVVVKKVCTPV